MNKALSNELRDMNVVRFNRRLNMAFEHLGFTGCVVPDCSGRPRLHHIVPKREGGSDGIHNRLPICAHHEMLLHKAGQWARANLLQRRHW